MKRLKTPLFPLSAHLLPGGKMALRIFEPRYVRMVKEVCASNQGFILCMLNAQGDREFNTHIHPIGTYSRIIDFETLEDGLLGITVEGLGAVVIENISTEGDGLRVGDCHDAEPWRCSITDEEIKPMEQKLQEIFDRYPEVANLYSQPSFNDPIWVINRWIEILPVDARVKQDFLNQKDCRKVLHYLSELVR